MDTDHTTLIEPSELVSIVSDPDLVVVDCRFSLGDTLAGRRAWRRGHIPGAVYAHLDDDLSGSRADARLGRHPLPHIDSFCRTLRSWAVHDTSQVVAYDDSGGAIAARLWWMMRSLSHDRVAVLNGGWSAWRRAGAPTSREQPQPEAGSFAAASQPAEWSNSVTADLIAERLSSDRLVLIDARDTARYRGEAEPIDPVAGRIPGALSRPFKQNLDATGQFLDAPTLRDRFACVADQNQRVISYCGSGVTACHNILAMVRAGLPPGALYAPSWSGWIADPDHPLESG